MKTQKNVAGENPAKRDENVEKTLLPLTLVPPPSSPKPPPTPQLLLKTFRKLYENVKKNVAGDKMVIPRQKVEFQALGPSKSEPP